MPKSKDKAKLIRYTYLYLVTAISIIMIIIAAVGMIRLVLEEYVFDVQGYEELDALYECGEGDYLRDPESEVVKLEGEELEKCRMEAMERRTLRHQNDVKRRLIDAIAMLLVAVPVYIYHWGVIRKEEKKK